MNVEKDGPTECKRIGFFERYLTVWVALCIVAGIALGKVVPDIAKQLDGMAIYVTSLGFLALLGGASARAGGAPIGKAVARDTLLGALAMAATAGVRALFGVIA
ncbi:MAG: hypothetical protein ACI814_002689 [Mariniblastus sp.]|jgi:hypothetical protein